MKRVVVAVSAVLAVVVVTALAADWRFLKPVVEKIASEKTGRIVTLTGFRMSLLPLRMHFEGLRIPEALGARRTDIIRVDEAEVQLALWPALHGKVVLNALAIRGGELYLMRSKDGSANWSLPGLPIPSTVRTVSLDQLLVFYDDRKDDVVLNLRVGRNPVRATAKAYPVFTEIDGTYRNSRFKGNAWTGSVVSLRDSDVLFPFKVDASIGSSRIKAEGTLGDILGDQALDVTMDASGHALSSLHPFLDVPLEATAPYSLKGRVVREETKYTLSDLAATLGKSDISGNASYDKRPGKPELKAVLRSQSLDLKDLDPLLGLDSSAPENPALDRKSPRKPEVAKKVDMDKRVLPNLAFDAATLNTMDADITFDATTVRAYASVFDNVKTHLVLDDRIFKLAPLDFGYAGGQLNASLTVDGRNQSVRAETSISLRKGRLNRLFPDVAMMKRNTGTLGADIKLKSQGTSLRTLLAHADGTMGFAAAGGELSSLLAEINGNDAAQALGIAVGGDKKTPLRCAAASFDVKQGIATAQALAMDTPDTFTRGAGTLSFADERLNIRLQPEARDKTIATARLPVTISGTFAYPTFKVERGALQQPGVTATPASTALIAALLPLVESGYGRDANCSAMLLPDPTAVHENAGSRRRR